MTLERIETATEIIDRLGGNPAVAEIVGAKPKAVSNWRKSNGFPARTYLAITTALREHNAEAPPSLWGMTNADAAEGTS